MYRLLDKDKETLRLIVLRGNPSHPDQVMYLNIDECRQLYRLLYPHFAYEMARDDRIRLW
jgi:hypothetical protein